MGHQNCHHAVKHSGSYNPTHAEKHLNKYTKDDTVLKTYTHTIATLFRDLNIRRCNEKAAAIQSLHYSPIQWILWPYENMTIN